MADQDLDYDLIRRRVMARRKRQKRNTLLTYFGIHLVGYVAAMVILWAIVILDSTLNSMAFAHPLFDSPAGMLLGLPTFGGAFALLLDFLALRVGLGMNEKNARAQLFREEIDQINIQRQLSGTRAVEKRKRSPLSTDQALSQLSDDGELAIEDEDEPALDLEAIAVQEQKIQR
jgi:hypothetical protein